MIVQSCVKDINIINLSGDTVSNDDVYITITVDSLSPQNTDTVSFNGNATMSTEICFDFDTSTTTDIISRRPSRGRAIKFEIFNSLTTSYGFVSTLFPNPINGSIKSSFISDTSNIQPTANFSGILTYSLYHQISLEIHSFYCLELYNI